jgi:hypothetical protein
MKLKLKKKKANPVEPTTLSSHGYFEFPANAPPILTEQQVTNLNSAFFNSSQQLEKSFLLAGNGNRYIVFHNVEPVVTPDSAEFNLHPYIAPSFSDVLATIFADFTQRFALAGLKIGAAEFLEYINRTDEERFGQITHLDGTCSEPVNRYGLFLPLRIAQKQSAFSATRYRNVAPNLLSVGTRIVDLGHYGELFDWNEAPKYRDLRVWHCDAKSRTLSYSHSNYSAIVVNKIPHGGGAQPPMSHRVTLFLYLVPMNWNETCELDITIPAVEFLSRRMQNDEEMIDLECTNDEAIRQWVRKVPDLYKHFQGEVERAQEILSNRKGFCARLKNMGKDMESNTI